MGFGKPTGPTTSDMLTAEERRKRIQEMKEHQAAAMGVGAASQKEPDVKKSTPDINIKTEVSKEAEAEEREESKKTAEIPQPSSEVETKSTPKKPGRKKGSKNKTSDDKESLERVNKCIRIDALTDMRLDLYCRKKSTGGQKVTPGDLVAMLLEADLKKNDPDRKSVV